MIIHQYEIFNIPYYVNISEKDLKMYSHVFISEKRIYFFSSISTIEYKKTLHFLSQHNKAFKHKKNKYVIKETIYTTNSTEKQYNYYYENI